MGCLLEGVLAIAYAFMGLIFALIAFALLGYWVVALMLLLLVALWLQGIYDESRPGELWRNVGKRVGAWLARTGGARATGRATTNRRPAMSSLPEHVSALHADLHPILASLYRALHNPDNLRLESVSGGLSSHLTEYRTALKNVFDAVSQLKQRIFEQADCAVSTRLAVSARFADAMEEMTGVYGAVLTLLAERPGEGRRIRLEHNLRANLERLAMWLADIQLALAEPRRILLEGRVVSDSLREMEFKLHLNYPEDLAELDAWADTPTGYEASHVREALAAERAGQSAMSFVSTATSPVKPTRPRSSGGWLAPLVIGWIIGDWFFDDGDGDC